MRATVVRRMRWALLKVLVGTVEESLLFVVVMMVMGRTAQEVSSDGRVKGEGCNEEKQDLEGSSNSLSSLLSLETYDEVCLTRVDVNWLVCRG